LFFWIVGVVFTTQLAAQPLLGHDSKHFISGRVADSASGQPLEYATISLFLPHSQKPVDGTTSDQEGRFVIKDVPPGNFRVVIEFIGYNPVTINDVVINNESATVDLKTILLVKKVALLANVTISATPRIVENKIDKIVFNAEQDITSQVGVATDILKKVPQVSVDVDGTVELAGNSSIRFLIDGKPSSAFGSNITDVLQSIPASQIKSIEVVTNPGAKYDAEGLGGIINIILKKNTARGINGNLSLTASSRQENGSFNFNAKNKNFSVNAFLSGNENFANNSPTVYDRVAHNADTTANLLHQDGNSHFNRHGIQSGMGIDWSLGRNTLDAAVNYNNFGRTGAGFINQTQSLLDPSGNVLSDMAVYENIANSFGFHNLDASLNYKRTFEKEDRELDMAVNSSFGHNNGMSANSQYLLPVDSMVYGNNNLNPAKETDAEFSVDYTEPVTKKVKLGAGGKFSIYDISSSSNVNSFDARQKTYYYDSALSNALAYHQEVYAVYSELSFPVGNLLDAKIGGRYERTDIMANYFNSLQAVNRPGYNTFVPSLFLLRKLGEDQTLKFSYSKRIERPDYGDLNPFINTSDPKNLSSGNPLLLPEIGNRYELSYSKDIASKGSVVITAFYRINKHDIQNYVLYYPSLVVGDSTYTNVAVSTRENIGFEKNLGLSVFGNINFTKQFSVRTNIFGFYRHTLNNFDSGQNSSSFNYRINVNVTYLFSKTLAGEFFGNFNSARHEAQGTYPSFTSYNIAVRKQIWKKKGSIAFTAVNPFNEYVNRKTSVFGPGFTVSNFQRIPFRSFGVNFTWKFGHLEFKKPREDNSINLNAPSE